MSKIRSCGSLASGNQQLLAVKAEPEDDKVQELLKKQEEMQKELAALLAAQSVAGSATAAKRSRGDGLEEKQTAEPSGDAVMGDGGSGSTQTKPVKPAWSIPTAKASPPAPEDKAEDEEHAGALQRYKMVDARLRRLCERKPSGKLNVPQAIHDQWMAGGKQRALFESYDFDKEAFVHKVTKLIEHRKEESQEVLKGWFTPEQMKTELHWGSAYIKDAVAYCKKHGLVKSDKYSSKVYRYFVEYSDKESSKKSRVESEQQSSTQEAEAEVVLSTDLRFEATQESEQANGDGGNVQTPAEGVQEIEQKFQDGMLTKMSKITDLISKLDGFAAGEDATRVKKCIQDLEAKLTASQTSYDEFVGARSLLGNVERTPENSKDMRKKLHAAMQKASVLGSVEAQAKALEKSLKKKKKEAMEEAEAAAAAGK